MFYNVASVTPLTNYLLQVQFENGCQKQYDVKPLFQKWDAFHDLMHIPYLFDCVYVDTGGYGICWNENLDISCNELWENGSIM